MKEPQSLMFEAITKKDVSSARELLSSHPDLIHAGMAFSSWLYWACGYDHVPMVELLVGVGLDLNDGGNAQYTPLDKASSNGCFEVARWLLDHGASIRPTSPEGGGTLICAVLGGVPELVRLLIEKGADVHAWEGSPPRNALSFAIALGRTEIADLLRANGATLPEQSLPQPGHSRDEIIRHLETHLGPVDQAGIAEVVPGEVAVWVQVLPPRPGRNMLTLFTTGMSDRPLTVPPGREDDRYAELLIHLPGDWPRLPAILDDRRHSWPVEWLRRAAHHMHEWKTWIGPGYGVLVNGNPPEPLVPGSPFDTLLLLGQGPPFGQFRLADNRLVRLYTAYPLYPSERIFEQKPGVVKLLERFEKLPGFPQVVMNRPSVAN